MTGQPSTPPAGGPTPDALRVENERLRSRITEMLDAVDVHVAAGEPYQIKTESSFFGPNVSKTITSKRGDLCDLRDQLERIAGQWGKRPRAASAPDPAPVAAPGGERTSDDELYGLQRAEFEQRVVNVQAGVGVISHDEAMSRLRGSPAPDAAKAADDPKARELVCAVCGSTQHYYREQRCEYHATMPDGSITVDRCVLDARHDGEHRYIHGESAVNALTARLAAAEQISDEAIDRLVADLDAYARQYDKYYYGLPMGEEQLTHMRDLVRAALERGRC